MSFCILSKIGHWEGSEHEIGLESETEKGLASWLWTLIWNSPIIDTYMILLYYVSYHILIWNTSMKVVQAETKFFSISPWFTERNILFIKMSYSFIIKTHCNGCQGDIKCSPSSHLDFIKNYFLSNSPLPPIPDYLILMLILVFINITLIVVIFYGNNFQERDDGLYG